MIVCCCCCCRLFCTAESLTTHNSETAVQAGEGCRHMQSSNRASDPAGECRGGTCGQSVPSAPHCTSCPCPAERGSIAKAITSMLLSLSSWSQHWSPSKPSFKLPLPHPHSPKTSQHTPCVCGGMLATQQLSSITISQDRGAKTSACIASGRQIIMRPHAVVLIAAAWL